MGGSSQQDPERFDEIDLQEYDLDELEVERLRDAPSQTPGACTLEGQGT